MRLADVIAELECLAPPSLAESWDNTGLLLGDRAADVERVLTCLTLTPDVAEEAVASGVQLVVAHHPLLFKPVQRLTSDTVEGRTLLMLLRHSIAVYSPHTAWDNAPQGINQQLAERLELTGIRPLRAQPSNPGYKIVTFVPHADLERVQRGLWDAGCGVIGNYRECSFYASGTGTLFGSDEANPAVGEAGKLERVEEAKLEVVCPKPRLATAIEALRRVHPYEEPAFDVIALESVPSGAGAGRCGSLPTPVTLSEFLPQVRERLDVAGLQWVGDPTIVVERVGIACGSAAEFWKDARRAGCQVLLTGEARFHAALEVRDAGFAMILAGHYGTERPGMEQLAQLLATRCPGITVSASAVERDPLAQ